MKRNISIFLCIVAVLAIFSMPTHAVPNDEKPLLSEMTEMECLGFVKDNGVILPDFRDSESEWGPFVKKIITLVEFDPDIDFGISYTVTADLAEEIRKVVNAYYGVDEQNFYIAPCGEDDSEEPTWLEDSEVYGTWDPNFLEYNCYSFSIGIYDDAWDPGLYAYLIGYIPEYSLDIGNISINAFADYVEYDLYARGNIRIRRQCSAMDTSNLCTNEQIICFRLGDEDYHFMKYTPDGWLHKPSKTQVLRYLSTPTDDDIWTNERVIDGIFSRHTLTYTGTICFISYNGHGWRYTRNNNNTHLRYCDTCEDQFTESCELEYPSYNSAYHKGTCAYCGYTTGYLPCSYEYSNNVTGSHKATCTVCGDSFTENCNLSYSSTGYYSHRETCSICGYTSTNQACSFSYMSNGDQTHAKYCTICDNSLDLGCSLVTTYSGNGMHHSECTVCGGEYDEACTAVKTYCGDGTLGDVHTLACGDCGNSMGTATESCTFEYIFTGTIDGHNVHSRICTECGYVKLDKVQCFYKSNNICMLCGQAGNIQAGGVWKIEDPVD